MLNNVSLMGRLTTDPELKQTQSGVSVTSFSLAVERNFTDKQSGKREADFINIIAWRGTADLICKYFSKGKLIALQGSFQSRNYKDKNGNKRTVIEVVAEQVFFTGEKKLNHDPFWNSEKNNCFPTHISNLMTKSHSPEDLPELPNYNDYEDTYIDNNDLPY